MEYSVFRENIKEYVSELAGEEAKVEIKKIVKNNGVELWAIIIKKKNTNVVPTIYLEEFYNRYCKSVCDFSAIALQIIDCYNENVDSFEWDYSEFVDYNVMKGKIFCKLVNTERNRTLLSEVPHKDFLDLSIIFYCLLEESSSDVKTCLVYNNHLDLWKVDVDELYKVATKNMVRKQRYRFRNMEDVLFDILSVSNSSVEQIQDEYSFEDKEMFVLTNERMTYGAICILYENLLSTIGRELGKDFYIIPSSIHEVIIVPVSDSYDKYMLMGLIQEVNSNEVMPEEILSYSLYRYYVNEERLDIA